MECEMCNEHAYYVGRLLFCRLIIYSRSPSAKFTLWGGIKVKWLMNTS